MLSSSSPFLRSSPAPLTPISGNRSPPSSVRFRPPRAAAASAERSYSSTCTAPPRPTSSASSLYDVLGISVAASGDEIKAAYRKLARICHPDVAASAAAAADEFVRINAAYSTLSDPEKRADYDRKVLRRYRTYGGGISVSPATAGYSGYTRRNWETDQCW